jgi:hypothetical protein
MIRKAVLIVIVIILILMTVMTYLVFDSENGKFLFSGGSTGSTMKFFEPNVWIVMALYAGALLSLIFLRKRTKLLLVVFLVFFCVWFISGRTVGIHWTGEVITGWFYISTDRIILSDGVNDCSEEIIACTKTKDSFPFCIILVNSANEKEIFVGPIIRPDLRNYFNRN